MERGKRERKEERMGKESGGSLKDMLVRAKLCKRLTHAVGSHSGLSTGPS